MPNKTITPTFSLRDVANVIDNLHIRVVNDCHYLKTWEQNIGEISLAYQGILDTARERLLLNRSRWNEEELKMKFISPVIEASQIEVPNQIQTFYERPLSGMLQGYFFSVICDCMVATPTQGGRPDVPYFFLQEFSPHLPPKLGGGWGEGDRNDPEAQMLVAMLLAQQANADGKPLYGAWLQGENWYFTVLNGLEYCRSKIYVATNRTQLEQIVYMLQYVKIVALTVNS